VENNHSKPVIVVQYDPAWPAQFQALHAELWPAASPFASSIEHVGSTAVPGLAAKPVIDLDIVLSAERHLSALVQALAALGYQHRGDLGIPGREAFRAPAAHPIAHHLYACPPGNLALRNHLRLRGYLRQNPAAARSYGELKQALARQHPHDMDAYLRGKTLAVLHLLSQAGLSPSELAAIAQANQ